MNRIRNILIFATTLLFSRCNAPEPPNKKTFKDLGTERIRASDSIHDNLRIVRGIRYEAQINPRFKIHALDLLIQCHNINERNKLNLDTIINFEHEQLIGNNLY
jgi:hypothetical protein